MHHWVTVLFAKKEYQGWRLAWYDFWIGAYLDRTEHQLYVCPVPFVVFKWQLKGASF